MLLDFQFWLPPPLATAHVYMSEYRLVNKMMGRLCMWHLVMLHVNVLKPGSNRFSRLRNLGSVYWVCVTGEEEFPCAVSIRAMRTGILAAMYAASIASLMFPFLLGKQTKM